MDIMDSQWMCQKIFGVDNSKPMCNLLSNPCASFFTPSILGFAIPVSENLWFENQKTAAFAAQKMDISRLVSPVIAVWQTFAAVNHKKKRPHL
jgi:hypothetical protein